jgi:hypothetical protein
LIFAQEIVGGVPEDWRDDASSCEVTANEASLRRLAQISVISYYVAVTRIHFLLMDQNALAWDKKRDCRYSGRNDDGERNGMQFHAA